MRKKVIRLCLDVEVSPVRHKPLRKGVRFVNITPRSKLVEISLNHLLTSFPIGNLVKLFCIDTQINIGMILESN
jgi:hypothetical protein